jgi:3-oxoacyl-[acyl-carrier-protein] synthase II
MIPPDARAPKVVVTGIGLITSLGMGREITWSNLREGRCGARSLTMPWGRDGPPAFGFPVPHGDHRPTEQVFKAAMEAVRDARIDPRHDPPIDRDRAGAVVGFSKGDLHRLSRFHAGVLAGREIASPTNWTSCWPNGPAGLLAGVYDLRGPCLAPVAACATGVIAVLQGADLIRRGACDVVLAGAGDSPLEPLTWAALHKLRVLARVEGDPAAAVRPWDRRRSGFLPGEGGAVLVLERSDHAVGRGVLPYAEVAGGAFGSDASHETGLDPDPTGLADLIRRAFDLAGIGPSDIDHVNLHGTATRPNDPLECRALRRALGAHADGVSCSANKAQIGHMLGAAGAAELAITCLAIRDGFVPPTLNLTDPDPACDLDGTPLVGRQRPIRAALKLSIGFGGHLAAAVLRRPEGRRRIREEDRDGHPD